MSGFNTDRNFNDLLNSLPNVISDARKRDAIAELERRIKRCQELIVYVQSINALGVFKHNTSYENMQTCINHVLSEFSEWKIEIANAVPDFTALANVVMKVQVASIENLNRIKSSQQDNPKE